MQPSALLPLRMLNLNSSAIQSEWSGRSWTRKQAEKQPRCSRWRFFAPWSRRRAVFHGRACRLILGLSRSALEGRIFPPASTEVRGRNFNSFRLAQRFGGTSTLHTKWRRADVSVRARFASDSARLVSSIGGWVFQGAYCIQAG